MSRFGQLLATTVVGYIVCTPGCTDAPVEPLTEPRPGVDTGAEPRFCEDLPSGDGSEAVPTDGGWMITARFNRDCGAYFAEVRLTGDLESQPNSLSARGRLVLCNRCDRVQRLDWVDTAAAYTLVRPGGSMAILGADGRRLRGGPAGAFMLEDHQGVRTPRQCGWPRDASCMADFRVELYGHSLELAPGDRVEVPYPDFPTYPVGPDLFDWRGEWAKLIGESAPEPAMDYMGTLSFIFQAVPLVDEDSQFAPGDVRPFAIACHDAGFPVPTDCGYSPNLGSAVANYFEYRLNDVELPSALITALQSRTR